MSVQTAALICAAFIVVWLLILVAGVAFGFRRFREIERRHRAHRKVIDMSARRGARMTDHRFQPDHRYNPKQYRRNE